MFSTLVAAAVLALLSATQGAPIATGTCYSGAYIIVARGSTEDPGEGKPGEVADMIAAKIPNSQSVAVDYPASIVDPVYPVSVSDGIKDTINKVHSYVDTCGDKSRIVLIGYSQGGNIMTDALAGGIDKPDPLDASYAKYITGVVVFGDPSFTANQTFDQGTSTSNGIFSRGGDSLAALNAFAGKLKSYCNTGDPFCARGTHESVHGAEVDNYKQAATDFIVSLAGKSPVPTPSPTPSPSPTSSHSLTPTSSHSSSTTPPAASSPAAVVGCDPEFYDCAGDKHYLKDKIY